MRNLHNVVSDALQNVRGGRGATQSVDNPAGDEIEYIVDIKKGERFMRLEVFLDHGGCTAGVLSRVGWSTRFMHELLEYIMDEMCEDDD